uniref:Uncharacterized protein n=1 Tax=Lactuca sativa TaxID=4236 RepID=A0A9R1VEE4_LACSA|nr:hypothetical protein LSAT_V11C500288210 [Lactuca sativa]
MKNKNYITKTIPLFQKIILFIFKSNLLPKPTVVQLLYNHRQSSLIDFDTDDPSVASVPQTQQIPPSVPVSLNDNWANFDSTPTPVVTKLMPFSQAPSSGANLLDMLSELSVPASVNNPQMSLFGTNPPPPPPAAAAGAPPSVFVPGGGVVNLYDDDGPVVGFSGWLNYWGCEARLAGR